MRKHRKVLKAYKISQTRPISPSLYRLLPYFVLSLLTLGGFLLLWRAYNREHSTLRVITISQWNWISNLTSEDFKSALTDQYNGTSLTSHFTLPVPGLGEKLLEIENGPIVNPHDFKYKLDPGPMICSFDSNAKTKPLILIYIHTDPSHDKRRLLIRETWGSPYNFEDFEVRTIFLCGIINSTTVQEALELEFDRYKDIVQEDFIDTYRNLTYKAVMALKWISKNCMNSILIIKADDDIFVNIFKMMSRLKGILRDKPNQDMFICNVWDRMMVMRDPKSKWYISPSEFPDDYFGRYCSGSAYAYTPRMVPHMYQASLHVPFFWVDDYYITGMLPAKLRRPVSYEEINRFYFLAPTLFLEKFMVNDGDGEDGRLAVGHSHDINQFKLVWRKVLKKYLNGTMG